MRRATPVLALLVSLAVIIPGTGHAQNCSSKISVLFSRVSQSTGAPAPAPGNASDGVDTNLWACDATAGAAPYDTRIIAPGSSYVGAGAFYDFGAAYPHLDMYMSGMGFSSTKLTLYRQEITSGSGAYFYLSHENVKIPGGPATTGGTVTFVITLPDGSRDVTVYHTLP